MREFAVIVANELNLHSEPGGEDTKIGLTVKKGQKYLIVKRDSRTQGEWAKIVGGWIMLHNKKTGETFAHVEQRPDAPVPPKPPLETDPFDWSPYGIVGALVAVCLALASCSIWG